MKRSAIWTLSKEDIQKKVNNCYSIADMLETFGYSRNSGGMRELMKKVIKTYDIDTSHFDRYKNCKPPIYKPKYSLGEILVPNSKYTNIDRLKKKNSKSWLTKV